MRKFLLALLVAFVLMLAFRALIFTVYTVPTSSLEPEFLMGDRVMVNRWSYGLRTETQGLFSYSRILRQPVCRGDLVAFNAPDGQVLICRCTALPGDTVSHNGRQFVVPGKATCAREDYYWLTAVSPIGTDGSATLGFIPEECIIGRAFLVVFNHDDGLPFFQGFRRDRLLLLK